MLMYFCSKHQVWESRRPATGRGGWSPLAGTWASARPRSACAWQRRPWGEACASHSPGTRGWGFLRGQSDGQSWQSLWKTWPRRERMAGSWKKHLFLSFSVFPTAKNKGLFQFVFSFLTRFLEGRYAPKMCLDYYPTVYTSLQISLTHHLEEVPCRLLA